MENAFNMGDQLIKLEDNIIEWPEPISFDNFSNLPDFPSQLLPSPGREMVEAVTETNQVDKGLPGSIYLAVLSTCLAKKGEVDLVTHTEPLNIYTCSVAEPGERKSSTVKLMTAPLYEYQKDKEIEMQDEIREAVINMKINEQRLNHLQKDAAKTNNKTDRSQKESEIIRLSKTITENPVPKTPVYIADDITSEAVGTIMADNNERLSIISAEGGIFDIMAGRYNERGGSNFDIYLKGHPGDTWSSHRIGRDSKTMLSPALTMCLTVQNDVVKNIGKNTQFKGRGLLARFLFNLNKSQAGNRVRQLKNIPENISNDYNRHIRNLMDIPLEPVTFKLSPDGQYVWDEFYKDVENEMKPGGSLESLKGWGSKLPGAVARISGLLHFAEHGFEAMTKPISVNTVNASCVIGSYYKEHALAVFGLMKEDPKIEAAKKILEYIKQHKPESFKERDILRHKSFFKTIEEIRPGLQILEERGHIREKQKELLHQKGRPEATVYAVNPKIIML